MLTGALTCDIDNIHEDTRPLDVPEKGVSHSVVVCGTFYKAWDVSHACLVQ